MFHDAPVSRFAVQIESADAQIFGLEGSLGGVRLHLIWRFWNPRAPEVWCTYWFPGATLHAEALTGGPLVPVCTPPDPN